MAQTNMVTEPPKTKMVAPTKPKTVKLKMLRDIADPTFVVTKEGPLPPMFLAGQIVDLPVSTAKRLLAMKFRGMYEFSGQRDSVEKLGVIRVAELYVEPKPEVDLLDEE